MAITLCPTDDEAECITTLEHAATVVLFKHSYACGRSERALGEMHAFAEAHPDVPIVLVDVIAQRPLSQRLAVKYDVEHESPQAIVLRNGRVMWYESHGRVRNEALTRAVAAATEGHALPSTTPPL